MWTSLQCRLWKSKIASDCTKGRSWIRLPTASQCTLWWAYECGLGEPSGGHPCRPSLDTLGRLPTVPWSSGITALQHLLSTFVGFLFYKSFNLRCSDTHPLSSYNGHFSPCSMLIFLISIFFLFFLDSFSLIVTYFNDFLISPPPFPSSIFFLYSHSFPSLYFPFSSGSGTYWRGQSIPYECLNEQIPTPAKQY